MGSYKGEDAMSELSAAVSTLAEMRQREAVAREMLAEIEAEVERKFGKSLAAARRYLQDTRYDVAKAETARVSRYWAEQAEADDGD